jgi:hypothetical protein
MAKGQLRPSKEKRKPKKDKDKPKNPAAQRTAAPIHIGAGSTKKG